MDIQRGNISLWLAIASIILSTGLMSHVMAIPVILNVAGRDSWIAAVIVAPLFIGWIYIFFYMINQLRQRSLIDWLNEHWGKYVTYVVKLICLVLLFFNALYTMIDTMMWTVSTYLQQTPILVVSLCTMTLCIAMAYFGLQSIAIVASILLPVVVFLGYFVSSSNMKYKEVSLLFPIFDNGLLPVVSGCFYVLGALFDIWILILFAHHVKKKFSKLQILLLSGFLIMMVLGPITGAITEFGPTEALKQRHTTFDQWKILSLGQLLQHVDFLSIYQWLSGSITRTALSMYLMVDIFQLKENKQRFKLLMFLSVIMFGLLFLKWREDVKLYILQHIYFPVTVCFVLIFTVAIMLTLFILQRKESVTNE